MRFIAAIDTVIYGKRYGQGTEVDISGWTRKQILQFLKLGLMQANQISAGMIADVLAFTGDGVSTTVDINGKTRVRIEMVPQDLTWLADVDLETNPPTQGDLLTFDLDKDVWVPRAAPPLAVEDLINVVDRSEIVDPLYWDSPVMRYDALSGRWFHFRAIAPPLDQLPDVDLSGNKRSVGGASGDGGGGTSSGPRELQNGDIMLFDKATGYWIAQQPEFGTGAGGGGGSVAAWMPVQAWDAAATYSPGPPASVVTYGGSCYIAKIINQGQRPDVSATSWLPLALMGAKGDKGDKGNVGDIGPAGPSTNLTVGSVVGGAVAAATVTGTSPNQVLNLTLPKGDKGTTGDPGPANTLSVGTVTTLAAGSTATSSITGVYPNQKINLGIPTGNVGANGPSAYQVALNNGFVGTEAEWLASLQGPPGDAAGAPYVGSTPPPGDASTWVIDQLWVDTSA